MMNKLSISSESLAVRNRIIDEHRKVIFEMRRVEKDIEQLLREKSPRWKELEFERNKLYVQIEPFVEQYWDWIQPVVLSRCPFCEKDLLRLFDPVDLSGFWWMDRTQRPRPEPQCCEHFCLLQGALDVNGQPFSETLFQCQPGPKEPFVIPRILELPSMIAVITKIQMHCGYNAYPIAYFSETPVQGRVLTQSWAKKEYHFILQDGRKGWDVVEDEYDFNLKPWLQKEKVRLFMDQN